MKKLRILSIVLVVVMLAATLSSCGTKEISKLSSFESVFDKNYTEEVKVLGASQTISEVTGYDLDDRNEYLALFKKADTNGDLYIVYNLKTSTVVGAYPSTESLEYTVYLDNKSPAYVVVAVTKVSTVPTETTYTLKDATGKNIDVLEEAPEALDKIGDYYFYDLTLYENKNGALTEVKKVPENLALSEFEELKYNDEYFYLIDDEIIMVFDKEFAFVSSWTAPNNMQDDAFAAYVLNNGNIFVQYTEILKDTAEKYDLYDYTDNDVMRKYDLISLIINPENGKTKEVELDYFVENLFTYSDMIKNIEDNGMSNPFKKEAFENLAFIVPIVNGLPDESETAVDIVTFSNNGTIQKSFKLADGQLAGFCMPVDKNIYLVRTVYGEALVDKKGELIEAFYGNNFELVGKYIVTERAIYDLNMEVLYDLKENKATVRKVIDDVIYLEIVTDDDYRILAFENGKTKEICNYDSDAPSRISFIAYDRFYALCTVTIDASSEPAAATYVYYNSDGTEIYRSENRIEVIFSTNDIVISKDVTVDTVKYVEFKIVK